MPFRRCLTWEILYRYLLEITPKIFSHCKSDRQSRYASWGHTGGSMQLRGLPALVCLPLFVSAMASTANGEDGSALLRVNHYVRVKSIAPSSAPSSAGHITQIYVREVVR